MNRLPEMPSYLLRELKQQQQKEIRKTSAAVMIGALRVNTTLLWDFNE